MKIYLASRYSRREELCIYRNDLQIALGHTVTSRWLNGDHQISDKGLSDDEKQTEGQRFAEEDVNDLLCSDLVISFTEEPRQGNSRGGRHVEFGMAIGAGIPNWIVGPRENVFHLLPDVYVFGDWSTALRALKARVEQELPGRGER